MSEPKKTKFGAYELQVRKDHGGDPKGKPRYLVTVLSGESPVLRAKLERNGELRIAEGKHDVKVPTARALGEELKRLGYTVK